MDGIDLFSFLLMVAVSLENKEEIENGVVWGGGGAPIRKWGVITSTESLKGREEFYLLTQKSWYYVG